MLLRPAFESRAGFVTTPISQAWHGRGKGDQACASFHHQRVHPYKPKFSIPELTSPSTWGCSRINKLCFGKLRALVQGCTGHKYSTQASGRASPASVLPEVLLQLRDGRQQLLALVAAKRQLQELRSPILNSHSANFLNHLDHSCKQEIRFRSQLLWTASKMSRKKSKNISINRPAILKLTRLKLDFTLGKCT